ncbi:MAG: nucleotidyltransferase [Acidobacteria bacterium]|nr:nucleotidyltransferase [Acidobacteriota bacterium]
MELDQDFNEFVQLLLANDVRFLIVGGYALAAHGAPRYTGDLDTWLWVNDHNADRMLVVLDSFGFGSLNITREDLLNPDTVIQLGYPPHRIDLLTGIDGVSFDEAWNRRMEVEVNGQQIPFISREDLITNKKAVARPQDLADVAKLEQ